MSKRNRYSPPTLTVSPTADAEANSSEADALGLRAGGLMVCVTGQRSCERLIEHGANLRRNEQRLYVVHCVQTGHHFLNNAYEPDAIEYLFNCASIVGAELAILRADNVVDALVEFAKSNGISQIILGASPVSGSDSFSARLSSQLPAVEFIIVE